MKLVRRISAWLIILTVAFNTCVFAENKVITPNEEAMFFEMVSKEVVEIYQFDMSEQELLERTIRTMLNTSPEMLDTFLKALFESLDEYSEFYTPEQYEEVMRFYDNTIGGIGVVVSKKGDYIEVVSVLDDGSAKAAGIMQGDLIFAVNDEEMKNLPTEYVTSKMKGKIGTEVKVTILRGKEKIDFVMARCELKQESVTYTKLTDKLGYINIAQFVSGTDTEFAAALSDFDSQNIKDIVIDLRNNTGGFVDGAVNIAKMLVPEGKIITHKMKYNDIKTEYVSTLEEKKYNVVALVNEYTASSSEILASALKESGAAVLVGEQTYGKAVTQNILGLYAGRACKVTTGEYYTRNGNSINKIGIVPDYICENASAPLSETTYEKFPYKAAGYSLGDSGVIGLNKRLSIMEYDVDEVDEYNQRTEAAVKEFQRKKGLAETGICDITTQIYIANEANSYIVTLDLQMAKALEILKSDYKVYTLKK